MQANNQPEAEAAERLAGARVKALEWSTNWVTIKAETPIGHYFIEARRDGSFDCRLENIWKTWASSSDEAKAAAQADYERRILSALAEPAGEFDRIVSDSSEFVASLSDSMRATGRSVFNPPEPAGEAEPVAWQNIETPSSILTPDQYAMRLPLAEGKFRPPYPTPPDASSIREAAEMARACLAGIVSAGHNSKAPDPEQIETAFWMLDKALAGAKP